ncbi:MAG: universal stress protein [Deltaproteobacteria bacterium]|nr:universal stress protein [Deltaproteobacteria bacterium]
MIEELLVCLDSSSPAEEIIPLARSIATAQRATLTLFRVLQDPGELAVEEIHLRDSARRSNAQIKFTISMDPAQAIIEELEKNPGAMAAMTTHGRGALGEALMGSVASSVLRGSGRPVILYRPLGSRVEAPKRISTVVIALDGSEFAEKIIPFAVEMAKSLAAGLKLIQALPVKSPQPPSPLQKQSDLVESSYLHRQAREIKEAFGVEAQWDVLHGDPADAICDHVVGMPGTMLAMTSHGRGAIQRALLGSVVSSCIRHVVCPLLLYWPR